MDGGVQPQHPSTTQPRNPVLPDFSTDHRQQQEQVQGYVTGEQTHQGSPTCWVEGSRPVWCPVNLASLLPL